LAKNQNYRKPFRLSGYLFEPSSNIPLPSLLEKIIPAQGAALSFCVFGSDFCDQLISPHQGQYPFFVRVIYGD